MATIASIREQLGSRGYLRLMGPTLSEDALRGIEATHGVALPDEYRAFLQQIGNGGPGPYYGLLPFEKALDYDDRLWGATVPTDHLSSPFPHIAAFNPEADHRLAGEQVDRGAITEVELSHLVHSSTDGTLGLAHHGCAYYDTLVVTGPTRGTVWHDASDTGQGFFPLNMGFFDWYQRWLDGGIVTMWKESDFATSS